jgi:hypothetical protein
LPHRNIDYQSDGASKSDSRGDRDGKSDSPSPNEGASGGERDCKRNSFTESDSASYWAANKSNRHGPRACNSDTKSESPSNTDTEGEAERYDERKSSNEPPFPCSPTARRHDDRYSNPGGHKASLPTGEISRAGRNVSESRANLQTQRMLGRTNVARDDPHEENRRYRVNQSEKQTTIERRSRPQRRGRPQPESVREEGPVGHARVTEEVVNPVKEPGEAFGIETGCQVPFGETVPQCVIGLPLGWFARISAEDAEIAVIYEAQNPGTDGSDHLDQGRQGGAPSRPFR